MLIQSVRKDQDVVQVDNHMSFVHQILEDVVHEVLECGRSIAETKGHDSGFEESPIRTKGCLPLVPFLDPNVVVYSPNIEFSEVLGVLRLVYEFLDQRQWVLVLDCSFVKFAVVLY